MAWKVEELKMSTSNVVFKRNLKIPKGQTDIARSEDRQDHGQENKTKDKHRPHDITVKHKAGVTRTLQKQG